MSRPNTYWKNRELWEMYHQMEDADEIGEELARFYENACKLLNQKMDKIFTRYQTRFGLGRKDAERLMKALPDGWVDYDALLEALEALPDGPAKEALRLEIETPAFRARLKRLEDIRSVVDEVCHDLYGLELDLTTRHYTDLAQRAYYHKIHAVQNQVGFDFSFAGIDPKIIDRVIRMPFYGKHYSQRIWEDCEKLAQEIKQKMLEDVIMGRPLREAAQDIGDRFGVGEYEAERLVRTESCRISNEMQRAAYEECGIEKYAYLATLDTRTSEICAPLDGRIFPVKDMESGKNAPPMHPFCRCTTVMDITKEELAGLQRRARDPVTGKNELVPASKNYETWAKEHGIVREKKKPK